MSYYYSYFIGYLHENKLYPLGPFNSKGKLKDVITRSRSFASDLHEDFRHANKDMYSDELRRKFEFKDCDGNVLMQDIKYLPVSALPSGSFVRRGYFLINDVNLYEQNDGDADDLFCDYLTPSAYAAKAANDRQFGSSKVVDEDGEVIEHPASDYMYYAYTDPFTKEYEAAVLNAAASILSEYDDIPEGAEVVILEYEG